MRYIIIAIWVGVSALLMGERSTPTIPFPEVATPEWVMMGQEPDPDTPNTTEPSEYAEGIYCTPHGDVVHGVQTPAHVCHCKHTITDKDCEGEGHTNNLCRQWCHEKHCHCPAMCTPSPEE